MPNCFRFFLPGSRRRQSTVTGHEKDHFLAAGLVEISVRLTSGADRSLGAPVLLDTRFPKARTRVRIVAVREAAAGMPRLTTAPLNRRSPRR